MNAKRERRIFWWAIVGSFFVHVIAALSLASFNSASMPLTPEEDKPIELTVMDLSATPPPMPRNPPFVDNNKEDTEEPKEKTFESNANSIAASNLPASGDAPLPSQEGREKPALDLRTQDYAVARQGGQPEPKQEPSPPPVATPTPPLATPTPASPPPSATPAPTLTPEPMATPEPQQLAMLRGTPPPPIRDPQEAEATPTPPPAISTPPLPTARPMPTPRPPASGYQAQKEQTKITGRISKRGASSVDAVGTPLGKYRKQVLDAIGSRWYYYMEQRMDLVSVGSAHLEAEVDPNGKVRNLRVISNDANEAFANICLQSFQEAQIPPIPPDLIATLPQGRLPLDINFTTYANR